MDKIEERIVKIIDENKDKIISFGRDIYTHAETGYKEFRTAEKFSNWLHELDLSTETGLAVTGVKACLNKEKKADFSLALLGEMDALNIPEHYLANPETGAAHCCGHHAQLTAVAGAALALCDDEIKKELDGQVVFFGVPAEEYGDFEYKHKLQEDNKIKYQGGKCELIRIGAFDDIDLCLAHHIGDHVIELGNGSTNGFFSKMIRYSGKASHAAVAPDKGTNALYAAAQGINALNANRETFRDDDHVRIHPIISKGGSAVNVIPDDVVVETMVRAANLEAMEDAARKTDRSFISGAMALGAKIEIDTSMGYLPDTSMPAYEELMEIAKELVDEKLISVCKESNHDNGSNDLGDLQQLIPVIQFRTGGMKGGMHQADYDIVDEETAYILSAKLFALYTYRMLKNDAEFGKRIKREYTHSFKTKEEYCEYIEKFTNHFTRDYSQE